MSWWQMHDPSGASMFLAGRHYRPYGMYGFAYVYACGRPWSASYDSVLIGLPKDDERCPECVTGIERMDEEAARARAEWGAKERVRMQAIAERTGGTFVPGRDHMAPYEDTITYPARVFSVSAASAEATAAPDETS